MLLTFAKVMERIPFFSYDKGHETPWNPRRVGEAAPTRHRIIEKREKEPLGHSPMDGGIQEFRLPLAPVLSREGLQGPEIQDSSRASAEVVTRAKREAGPVVTGRASALRVSDRPVDLAAGGSSNSEELWHPIPPQPCLAVAFGDGVELPETRTPGFAEKGRRNRLLEEVSLAAYKKTPKDLAPTCFFSMRAAFCSFLRSRARGLPRERRPIFTISIRRTRFRRSVLWPCLPKGNGWPFLSSSVNAILMVWMSALSLKICSNIFEGLWSFCGIGEPSIAGKPLKSFWLGIPGCGWSIFRLMHRNSILRNMFGIGRIIRFATALLRIWWSSKGCSEIRCEGYEDLRTYFGHAFMPLTCHGLELYRPFHYLCETQ